MLQLSGSTLAKIEKSGVASLSPAVDDICKNRDKVN